MKQCACCQELKPKHDFHNSRGHGGLYPYCKPCTLNKSKIYYAKPQTKERVKKYYATPIVKLRIRKQKQSSPRQTLSIALNRAFKRCKIFTARRATINDLMCIWEKQKKLCAISGLRMTWATGKASGTSISIDRIDQQKGYSPNNIRLVCLAVNRFRGDGSDAEMLTIAKAIVENA